MAARDPALDRLLASLAVPARARARAVIALTDAFAARHLDAEYAELCRRMTAALARGPRPPLLRGEARSWAAGVVRAAGWVNFLDDPSQTPHLPTAEVARRMDVGASTMAATFRTVRDLLDLVRLDPRWTRPSRLGENPLAWLVEVDGLLLDARDAPRGVQEAAARAGLIPYVPDADGRRPDDAEDAENDVPPVAELFDAFDALPASARAAVERALGEIPPGVLDRVLDGDELPPEAVDAVNSALAGVTAAYNEAPQAELGGLSPVVVERLLTADWEDPEGAVRVLDDAPAELLGTSATLADARRLLALLAEHAPVRATPKGNLSRAVVAAFMTARAAERRPDDDDLPPGLAAEEDTSAAAGRRNEEDVWPLHRVRVLLDLAGLVKRRRGVWSRTRRGDAMAAPEQAGALLALLVRTHFRVLNLAYVDNAGEAAGLQETAAYTLYQFGATGDEWRTPSALRDRVVLPAVREAIEDEEAGRRGGPLPGYDPVALVLETRVLRPLVGFGLAETRRRDVPPGQWRDRVEYRPSALFGRVLRFDVGAASGER